MKMTITSILLIAAFMADLILPDCSLAAVDASMNTLRPASTQKTDVSLASILQIDPVYVKLFKARFKGRMHERIICDGNGNEICRLSRIPEKSFLSKLQLRYNRLFICMQTPARGSIRLPVCKDKEGKKKYFEINKVPEAKEKGAAVLKIEQNLVVTDIYIRRGGKITIPYLSVLARRSGVLLDSMLNLSADYARELWKKHGDFIVRKRVRLQPDLRKCSLTIIYPYNILALPLRLAGKMAEAVISENCVMTELKIGDYTPRRIKKLYTPGCSLFGSAIELGVSKVKKLAQKHKGIIIKAGVKDNGLIDIERYDYNLPEYVGMDISVHYDESGERTKLVLPGIAGHEPIEIDLSKVKGKSFTYTSDNIRLDKILKGKGPGYIYTGQNDKIVGLILEHLGSKDESRDLINSLIAKARLTPEATLDLLNFLREAKAAAYRRVGEAEREILEMDEEILALFKKRGLLLDESVDLMLDRDAKWELTHLVTQGLEAQDALIYFYSYLIFEIITGSRALRDRLEQNPKLLSFYYSKGAMGLKTAALSYAEAEGTSWIIWAARKIESSLFTQSDGEDAGFEIPMRETKGEHFPEGYRRYSWSTEDEAIENIFDALRLHRPDIINKYEDIDNLSDAEIMLLQNDIYNLTRDYLGSIRLSSIFDKRKTPYFNGNFRKALSRAFNNPKLGLKISGFRGWRAHLLPRRSERIKPVMADDVAKRFKTFMAKVSCRNAYSIGAEDPYIFLSACMVGLQETLGRYPAEHKDFAKLAVRRMEKRITDQIREESALSRTAMRRISELNKAEYKLHLKGNFNPSGAELSKECGMAEYEVACLLRIRERIFLSALVRADEYESEHPPDIEVFMKGEKPEEAPGDRAKEEIRDMLDRYKDELSVQERRIIELLCLDPIRPTTKEIGYEMDISQSRVSQLHNLAVGKLKKAHQLEKELSIYKKIDAAA
ncbi:MAG: sigma-70 family RNA polymerase sigma factor [Candidatus Omnitrophota bacterium]